MRRTVSRPFGDPIGLRGERQPCKCDDIVVATQLAHDFTSTISELLFFYRCRCTIGIRPVQESETQIESIQHG